MVTIRRLRRMGAYIATRVRAISSEQLDMRPLWLSCFSHLLPLFFHFLSFFPPFQTFCCSWPSSSSSISGLVSLSLCATLPSSVGSRAALSLPVI
ncbi:hypothetical protein FA95DRAFT_18752 [Auriscalpium vulgare]|uniref:Uncharacterized protein n=1 Tax=Auriscalpium vulgare TaxID=40419 RepID=A0ACB8SDH1_9AGAM|nr:hypothetical protein FA95DRAFT_18752 [Auriscalpium vulgare]